MKGGIKMRDGIYTLGKHYYFKVENGESSVNCWSEKAASNSLVAGEPRVNQKNDGIYVGPIKPFEVGDRVYDKKLDTTGVVIPLESYDDSNRVRVLLECDVSLLYNMDGKCWTFEHDGIRLFHDSKPKNITVEAVIASTTCDEVKLAALSYEPEYGYYGEIPISKIKPEHVGWLAKNGFGIPEVVTVEGWYNVYEKGIIGTRHETEMEAKYSRSTGAVGDPIFISHSGVVK